VGSQHLKNKRRIMMGEKIEDSLEVVGDTLHIYRRVCVPNPLEFVDLKFEVERQMVDGKCEKCKGIGYINDELSGTLICECTFRKAGFGVKHVYSNGTQMGELGKAILNKDCPACKGSGFLGGPRGVLRCYCRDKETVSTSDSVYLGDGAYARYNRTDGMLVYTHDGVREKDMVFLDDEALRRLFKFAKDNELI
jgi:phage FluMu protein Com